MADGAPEGRRSLWVRDGCESVESSKDMKSPRPHIDDGRGDDSFPSTTPRQHTSYPLGPVKSACKMA